MTDMLNSSRLSNQARFHSLRRSGFTLIELMIVVAVIAILMAVAYPSYIEHVVKAKRKAAAACLLEAAQFMERRYTLNLTYVGADPDLACENDVANDYTIGLVGAPTATTYSLAATPIGSQAMRDTKCGTLGINQAGVRTKSGTASSVDVCWG